MLTTLRSYFYRFKRFQKPLETYVFPVILFLYPFIGVNRGLDIADTTYSLSNFQYLKGLDPMWALSTYLANAVGSILMKLPFGGTMPGIGIYCTLFICAAALAAYYLLQRWMPGWMNFIGIFMAESLFWCPRVILYNTLTYLFMTLGVLLLLIGLFEWEKQTLFLVLAGVCLGLNVMVRFPNITEAALILILWFFQLITRGRFIETVKKTFICIGGYLIGLFIPFAAISFIYSPMAYFNMIGGLFGMTEGASDYTAGGMLASIVDAYLHAGSHMLIMLPCIGAGIIMFLLLPDKYVLAKKVLYILGLLVLVRFYFAQGVFTRNYWYYDSVFPAAMMFIIFSIIMCVIGSLGVLNGSKQEQTLAFAALMIILITPLGSNNYTYPVINNLFVAAPISLWIFRRLMQRMGEKSYHFPWQAMITMVIVVILIQGAIFHGKWSFGDGVMGSALDSHVDVPKVSRMATTRDNADSLNELAKALEDNGLKGQKVILFGGVPGLSYIFDMEPAINTVWPDLDSYSVQKFDDQLMELSVSDEAQPVIIVGSDMADYANIQAKYDILLDYITNHDYNKVFENNRFMIFACNE
ncbi:hypothetical protein [Butyrivibrio sp. FCS014]|uniref:hypothetical protein n=1 Tax=Butyrivibrio sp. FCS014 TaxID=1408304 RepID=UPI000465C4D0|nr:hypothetical protein [Butyrivibrio sp. FCS014]